MGTLTLENSMEVLRDTYKGTNNLIIYLIHNIGFLHNTVKQYGYLESLHQMAAYPKTGEIYISFADRTRNAWETEIHQFNFYDLLQAEPP